MKNILKTLLAGVVLTSTISCNQEFLETKPTKFISSKDLKYSGKIKPEITEATLGGIYTQMITPGIGGTQQQEDFGHKSFDIFGDLLSSDMALVEGAYDRFVSLSNLVNTTNASTIIPNYTGWRYFYTVIKSANIVIESAGGNDFVPTNDKSKDVLGQAKALRAYAYFYLSQYYVTEYDADKLVLPLYTVPNSPAVKKSSMKEVYDLIISDLSFAVENLNGLPRATKTNIDVNVARGLLAYAYAYVGDTESNQKAKQLTEDVINSGAFTLMSAEEVTGGFTLLSTPGWMWGFDITTANALGLVSWHGFMDYYSYSYQAVGNSKGIDINLYNKISNKDIRKTQFDADKQHMPIGKFYNLKKKNFGQRQIEDDYIYMRVAEMYLLSAEMSAVLGDEADAKSRLKDVLAKRFSNSDDYAYVDNLTGQALIDEIVFQTKIEFLGEGKSYLLMKRRKLKNKRGSNHLMKAGESFDHNDPRLTFEIPLREIQDNPLLN